MPLPVVLAPLARKFGPKAAQLLAKLLREAATNKEFQTQMKEIARSRDSAELKRNLKKLPTRVLTPANLEKVLAACTK